MKKSIDSHNSDDFAHSQYEEFLESIVDTIRESLLILDTKLRVISANKTFYEKFKAHPKQTENVMVYELGNGQWNIPQLRHLLENILPTHNPFNNFRVEHNFPRIGRKVMLLNARQIKGKGNWKDRILLAIEDVTQFDKDRLEREKGIQRERTITEELRKSEIKFQTLTALAPVGIFMTDTDGNCLYVNEKWQEIANMKLKKALGKGWAEALHPEDSKRVYKEWYDAAKKNKEFFSEYRFQTKKGKVTWVEGKAIALKTDSHVAGFIGTITDITARRTAENALKESETRFRTLADSSPMLMWVNGLEGCEFVNRAYLEFLGVTPKDVTKFDWAQFIHPDDRKQYIESYLQAFAKQKNFDAQFRFRRADGMYRWMKSLGVPRFDAKGKFLGYVGSTIDITELQRLAQQKDEFLGIASHELKTPVTSIKAYGQVLQTMFRRKGDMKAVEALQKMDAQVNKLTNLIGDLLDVTKIQSGRLEFHEEFFDFNELVSEIVDEMQLTTERHTLEKKLGKTKSVYGDRERVGQILTNLISNAIKYSPHSGKIQIITTPEKEKFTVCVQDFGVGIPKEKQDKIFEQFFRVSGPKYNTVPGLGLGLYISSEIIKRQGGRIWVESTEGKGSTFCFSLPLRHAPRSQKNTLVNEEIQHE